jgi:hypothetical protein
MAPPARLRFGIMCRGLSFPEWQARCLQRLLAMGTVEPALLIIDGRTMPLPSPAWKKLARLLRLKINLFSLYNSYRVPRSSLAARPVNISAVFADVPRITCEVLRKGKFSEYFQEEDLARIRTFDLDFILRFGFGIIRGEILKVPRYGVWSFHHGDEQKYRGAPPCFWEINDAQPETGVMLQRLTDRLDGGIVLKKGWFRTIHHSYPSNRDCAHFLGVPFPAEACEDILAGRADYFHNPPVTTNAPVYLLPDNRQMIVFGLKQVWNSARHILHSLGALYHRASESAHPAKRLR